MINELRHVRGFRQGFPHDSSRFVQTEVLPPVEIDDHEIFPDRPHDYIIRNRELNSTVFHGPDDTGSRSRRHSPRWTSSLRVAPSSGRNRGRTEQVNRDSRLPFPRRIAPRTRYTKRVTRSTRHYTTAIGFRRNIKWFLGALVGFLVTLILMLLLFLQTVIGEALESERDSRRIVFDSARTSVESAGGDTASGTIEGQLAVIRGLRGVVGVELTQPDGTTVESGQRGGSTSSISRSTSAGMLTVHFDPSPVENLQRRFLSFAAIVLGATVLAVILLMFLLPRIVRPIDRMLEDARELGERDVHEAEDHYLIETFRSSIARLREQEEELRRLHDFEKARADDLERITATLTRSLSSGFIALDPAGRVIDVNRAAVEILDLDGDTTAGELTEVVGRGGLAETIRSSFARRVPLSRHEVIDDGRAIVLGVTTVPLYDEDDQFLGMLVLFTDLSGIKQLEQRMREMQALADLGQISAGIAHEFRNSLGTILGYLRLARRQEESAQSEDKLKKAESEGHRLAGSINSLLAFARPVSLELERIELDVLLKRVVERVAGENSHVRITLEGDRVAIEGDLSLLETVFENLVRNAMEAIPATQSGAVTIALQNKSEGAAVSILDTGTGIDEELLPKVFLPFQTGKASGTGLGLPLARKIVLLHGGSIAISNTSSAGTEVRVELPGRPE